MSLKRILKYHGAMREADKWSRGNPFIGYLNSSADWKSWSADMKPFLKLVIEGTKLRPGEIMNMTISQLEDAAGVDEFSQSGELLVDSSHGKMI